MVCQRWHQLVTPLLWKVPILPSPSYDHRQTTLVTFFRALRLPKYGHAIHTLTLDHTKTDNDNRHFIAIMQHCPNLKVLDFADALTTKGYHYLARAPCAPGLTCLMLTNDESLTDDILITLAMRCRSLQRIELVGCRRITQRGIQALVARQQQLICLNLKDCNQVSGQILQDLGRLCGDSLVSLDVTRIGAILHSDLQALVGFCPRLEYLALGRPRSPLVCQLQYRIRMEQDKSRRTMARSKSSTPISRSSRNKNNNKAESVMSLLEQHESILSYSSRDQVSHATVEMILSELTCLKSLDLTHWTCLTDPLLGRKQMKYPSSCR
ncbi:hypothetical protein BC941DRAFT_444260 [Chlamydoabsidia padenii]|nr:hypothetical protein BC941DRAFT_444260 [Chlamydoabsidia padenii]